MNDSCIGNVLSYGQTRHEQAAYENSALPNFSYLIYIDTHRCIPPFASSFALCERTEGLESGKGSCNDVLTAVLVFSCPRFELLLTINVADSLIRLYAVLQ